MASGSCVRKNGKRSASAAWSQQGGQTSTRKAPKRQSRLPYKKQRVSVTVTNNAAADTFKAMYRSNISGVINTVLELEFGEGQLREIWKTPFAAMVDAIRAHDLNPKSFKKCDATVCRIIKTYNPKDEKFHIGGAKLPLRNNDIRLIFGLQCGKDKLDLSQGGKNVMDVDPVTDGGTVAPSFNCWHTDAAEGVHVRADKNSTPTSKEKMVEHASTRINDLEDSLDDREVHNVTQSVANSGSNHRAASNSRSGDSNGADTKRSSNVAQQSSSPAEHNKGLASPTHEAVQIVNLGEDVSNTCADGLIVWDGGESGIQVHFSDIKDLVQENSIHGNVIDAYGAMLCRHAGAMSGRREYQATAYVYSSMCADMMRNTSAVSRTKYLNVHTKAARGSRYTVYPIYHANHWTVMVHDSDSGHWKHYNSLRPRRGVRDEHYNEALKVKQRVAEHHNNFVKPRIGNHDAEAEDFNGQLTSVADCSQQSPELSDCGIFVCFIVKQHIREADVNNTMDGLTPTTMRAAMVEMFLSSPEKGLHAMVAQRMITTPFFSRNHIS
ncbi:hypothetical protein LOK49_LG14G00376 [Camellia lanceoleosa]|uniref:Uncharacterized protein n=1 Tax=Camellia lanceoleosa TaxID=1840588 RepID=A0ACC0FDQ6_9ERIC|nr:hypothetical protein LOK49_LG14G00376 [Camellia lanceoleosa]